MVSAKIASLALDATTKSPVVVLSPADTEETGERVLPIWIGHSEAWVIAMELANLSAARPMTHDLLRSALHSFDAKVTRVDITELKEQTFYATITISQNGGFYQIDARPSDSIAMALKFKAPIYVAEDLFHLDESDQKEEAEQMNLTNDPESLQERLRKINPEDFGNYSL
ncbi:MAG: bifunctional nuclease family protein [Candidatus Zixiibacteriota bacterium]